MGEGRGDHCHVTDRCRNSQKGGTSVVALARDQPTHLAALWGRGEEHGCQCWPAWLKPWLRLFLAVRPEASFLTFLCLGFHICEMGVRTGLTYHIAA